MQFESSNKRTTKDTKSTKLINFEAFFCRSSKPEKQKSKCLNLFVDLNKSKKKKKLAKKANVGFEYDHDVKNDNDLCKKIIQSNAYYDSYNPSTQAFSEASLEYKTKAQARREDEELAYALAISEKEYTNKSPVIVHPAMTSDLSANELERTLGKYAIKKLGRKVHARGWFEQEKFYIIKLKWLIKMAEIQNQTHKYNLNNFRLTIEKIIVETSPAFEIHFFKDQKKVANVLSKLSQFLSKLNPQKAILLSYKLFKVHLKQMNLDHPANKQEIASTFYSIFLPYIKLMEIKEVNKTEKRLKNRQNLMTYKKLKKLSQKPEIVKILNEYQDPKKSPEYSTIFKTYLNEKVTLDQALTELTTVGKKIILEKNIHYEQSRPTPDPNIAQIIKVLGDYNDEESARKQKRIDFFDDSDNLDTEENVYNAAVNLPSYNFTQICIEKVATEATLTDKLLNNAPIFNKPIKKESIPISLDDSSNDYQNDVDGDSDQELMDDPDLYDQPEHSNHFDSAKVKKLNYKVMIPLPDDQETKPTEYGAQMGDSITPSAKQSKIKAFFRGNSSFKRDRIPSSDDAGTVVDPIRVTEKLEIYKNNSANDLPKVQEVIIEDRQDQIEQAKNENMVSSQTLRSKTKSSAALAKSLTMSKTGKEMIFQKVLGIASDDVSKWESVVSTKDMKVEKIKPEDSPVVLIRAWAVIEGFQPEEVFNQIYDTQKRIKWDNVNAGITSIERIDDTSDIIYFIIKTPIGIQERDFLQRRDYLKDYPEKGTITIGFQSCQHPLKPPTKARIRAETHIAGYVIKPSTSKPNSTDLCVLTQVDIKGKVPKAIVNLVASKAPAEWINKLKKACEKSRSG